MASTTVFSPKTWYFENGCSRHMTGHREFLSNYRSYDGGHVSCEGGATGRIVGTRTLNFPGLPSLTGVLHVEGLRANIISISQLCDDNLQVRFSKEVCEAFNSEGKSVMKGLRSKNNCYSTGATCFSVQIIDEVEVWHQRLGHTSIQNLEKLVKIKAVRGIEKLLKFEIRVCDDCQQGKQTNTPHPA